MNFGFKNHEKEEVNPVKETVESENPKYMRTILEHELMILVGVELQKKNLRFRQEYVNEKSDDCYLFFYQSDQEIVSKIIMEKKEVLSKRRALDSKLSKATDKKLSASDKETDIETSETPKIIKGKTIENRKRDRRFTLRMTEEEYINLLKKVDESGKNTTDFLNELIAKGHVRTLKIPIASEELVDEIHEIKTELRALRTANGKTAGLVKKAIHLNEGNGWMNENDFHLLNKYLQSIEERNKIADEKIADAERKLKDLWQT